jgi:Skp family chaperone for outer membrane proteins
MLKENIMSHRKLLSAILLATFAAASVGSAFAAAGEGQWAKDHPRRAEVNKRLANQNRRINKEVKEGEISKAEAAKLHKEDRQIRREERLMASQNGGHITKQEQRTLNQQENAVSRQIGK